MAATAKKQTKANFCLGTSDMTLLTGSNDMTPEQLSEEITVFG